MTGAQNPRGTHWTPGPWYENQDAPGTVCDIEGVPVAVTGLLNNVPLIAAAPEMAELLEGWLRRYPADLHDESEGTMELLSRIRSET